MAPEHYDGFLNETQEKRKQLQMAKNKAVKIDNGILSLLNDLNDLSLLSSGKKDKRVVMRPIKKRKEQTTLPEMFYNQNSN